MWWESTDEMWWDVMRKHREIQHRCEVWLLILMPYVIFCLKAQHLAQQEVWTSLWHLMFLIPCLPWKIKFYRKIQLSTSHFERSENDWHDGSSLCNQYKTESLINCWVLFCNFLIKAEDNEVAQSYNLHPLLFMKPFISGE